MPIIRTEVNIHAPIHVCFDVARDINIHMKSTATTKEKAIAGRTSGHIQLGESVTWEAVHLGITFRLTSKVTQLIYPTYFVDEMTKGPFKRFKHEHFFIKIDSGTKLIDVFDYSSPFGVLGKFVDGVMLAKYMREFLLMRGKYMKKYAEQLTSDQGDS
ncbi:SRPBCC family protein [Marininema halotolerans]|uniref:SRPBCC family protein n=1 Tax=Marininema halotolerans TaxID=1155944 RepID=UPI000B81F77E|nr:SRPBCC family protein [Marininema halotolerans]